MNHTHHWLIETPGPYQDRVDAECVAPLCPEPRRTFPAYMETMPAQTTSWLDIGGTVNIDVELAGQRRRAEQRRKAWYERTVSSPAR